MALHSGAHFQLDVQDVLNALQLVGLFCQFWLLHLTSIRIRRSSLPTTAPSKAPGSRSRGRYAKSSRTRGRILAAAFHVAGKVGLHRTALAAIAERAGVAVGNLHGHFGSRDDLLRKLMEWVQAELLAETEAAVAAVPRYLAAEEALIRACLGDEKVVSVYMAFVRKGLMQKENS